MKKLLPLCLSFLLIACENGTNSLDTVQNDDSGGHELCVAAEPLNDETVVDEEEELRLEFPNGLDDALSELTELGSCREGVDAMYAERGAWTRVTETESSTSFTHYYFTFASGEGFGFNMDSTQVCRTNYRY